MLINTDLSQVVPERDHKTDLLPAGEYTAKVIEVEGKETKSGSGHYLSVLFEIVDGEHVGKRFMDNLNIIHSNAEAQRIALSRLKGILQKGGHNNPNYIKDTDEMLGLTVVAKLEVSTYGENNDKTSNDVKSYRAVGSNAGSTPVAATVAPAAASPAAPAANPVVTPPTLSQPSAPVPPVNQAPQAPAGNYPWGQPS